MKRLTALTLTLAMVLSLSGCNTSSTDSASADVSGNADETLAVADDADNLIENGTFDAGIAPWTTYTNGGLVTLKPTDDKQMEISITSPGTLDYAVQPYYDGFGLDSGCEYTFSFDVSSTVTRTMEWRIQVNGGDYHAYVSDKLEIGEEVTHVEQTFTMSEGSDPAPRLCLNLGMVEGCPDDLGEHSVYVDNFVLKLTDDSNIVVADDAPETMDINVNQVGYRPADTKKAIIRGEGAAAEQGFTVVNTDTGESVFSGKVSEVTDNEASGEQSAVCDFSQVTTEGNYKIVSDKSGESATFAIAENVYDDLLKDTLKMLYLQRCGEELTADTAGDFAHPACHTSEATIYGTSTKKDVSGGWHDAGDYGRYTVSGAKAVADLLLAYENHADAFDDALGIPESGNGVADVLDEARYELEWLLKMQDEESGGVYHKVTAANFPETVMPQEEVEELLLLPISNAATGDFAAVMSMAGRIYKNVDSDFAKTCIKAAKNAIDYINSNDDDGFTNPTDVATGEYPDTTWYDEQLWALTEYYKTTGNQEVHEQIQKFDLVSAPNGLGWQAVGYYALYAYLSADNIDGDTEQAMKERLQYSLKTLFDNSEADIYESTLSTNYMWGSNMTLANNAMILDLVMTTPAYSIDSSANPSEYKALAAEQVNYLLGKNATSYCFVTGYGTLSPENPHHRPSQVLEQAMKGMLVGGADSNLEDPYAKATMQDVAPAKCYADNAQSYSCNEVTVYWNSPLVYALSALQ